MWFQDCNDRPGCVFRYFRPGHPALPPSLQVSEAHELLGGIYGEPKMENQVLYQGLGGGRQVGPGRFWARPAPALLLESEIATNSAGFLWSLNGERQIGQPKNLPVAANNS